MPEMDSTGSSSLNMPSKEHADKPFFNETVTLLRAVRDHDFETLAGLCDDDFGIVDIAPDGSGVPIRTRPEWEAWFRDSLFPKLEEMGAATDSEILGYEALRSGDLGYGVLDFRQTLTVAGVAGVVATFDCIATLIWKRTSTGWVESRWHCSVISSEVPESLQGVRARTSRKTVRPDRRGRLDRPRDPDYLTATSRPRYSVVPARDPS